MVSVLVIGSTGYIGTPLSVQLKKRGHTVYGLVRDAAKASELEKNGINVIVGDINKVELISEIVKKVDVVVNTTMDFTNLLLDTIAFNNVSEAIEKASGAKRRFVFVSGCLVTEPSPNKITEETPYLSQDYIARLQQALPPFGVLLPNRIVAEKNVLSSTLVSGVVVRAPLIYGQNKGAWTIYFKNAEEGKLVVYGDENAIVGAVHVEDVVDGVVKIIEADNSKVTGQIFQFSEEGHTHKEVAYGLAKGVGKEVEKLEKVNEAIPIPFLFNNGNYDIDSSKASRVLSWSPSHNLIKDAADLYKSWKLSGVPARW